MVLAATVSMLVSMAYLRGGHPPGCGIVNLVILIVVYPVSVLASLIGLNTSEGSVQGTVKAYFVTVGVSLAFAVFATILFFLKFVRGRAIWHRARFLTERGVS